MKEDTTGNILLSLSAFFIWLGTILSNHYFIGIMTGIIVILTTINYLKSIRNKNLIAEKLKLEIKKLKNEHK